jgi:FlaA1/EpsC-like NDP-sugar epimerase
MNALKGKKVLIIGATGTLGSEFVEQLLLCTDVESIRAYARHEESMFWLREKYGEDRMRYLIGDIRDKERLSKAYDGVDVVINCAAMKHVRICEENPFETVKTNVGGVQNAIECAIEHDIDLYIQISTDKAVNPRNVYGASKLMAENLTLDAMNYQGNSKTKFVVIRSGNIMGSSGSCLQIWDKQHKDGLPLTITDFNATRYMASRESIVSSIINKIISHELNNGLYVLNMPKYSVRQLVDRYINANFKLIGLQEGEKLEEELFKENEKYTLIDVEE